MVVAADCLHVVNPRAGHEALVDVREAIRRHFGIGARDVLGEVSMLGVWCLGVQRRFGLTKSRVALGEAPGGRS